MPLNPTVLIVEQNAGHCHLIEEKFRVAFPAATVLSVGTLEDASDQIDASSWDVVIMNSRLPDGSATDFLHPLSHKQPHAAVVILTEDPSEEILSSNVHHGLVEFLTKDRHTLDTFALRLKRLMATSQRIAKLLQKGETSVTFSAFRDPLTQVYSREYFDEYLRREVSRANRYHQYLSVLIADVDHMKDINRQRGHKAGDECLKELSEVLVNAVRDGDVVARYEKDRFVILLPQCRRSDATLCAKRVLNRLDKHMGKKHFTASIGVMHYQGTSKALQPEKILSFAEQAMKRAKAQGGNRYLIAVNH